MQIFEAPIEQHTISIEDAHNVIGELRQRIAAMGANDSEFWSIEMILGKLDSHEITPEEAIEEATMILEGKQDYH